MWGVALMCVRAGGTVLGTSRGPQDVGAMIECLLKNGINVLFIVGGDGSQKAAHAIAQEILRRGLRIAVVGIPKTVRAESMRLWGEKSLIAPL